MHDRTALESDRIRLLFVIPSFRIGGAEVQLLSLVRGLDKSRFDVTVAVFNRQGELEADFINVPDVEIVDLQKSGAADFRVLPRLITVIRRKDIQIVQSYNVSARLFGMLAAKLVRSPKAVATERTARLIYSSFGSRIYLFLEKFVLRAADAVIANSKAGKDFAESRGALPEKTFVIHNGIDADRLTIKESPLAVRSSLGIPASAFVVGMAARIERIKDPLTLMNAARILVQNYDDLRFLLVGDGPMLKEVKAGVAAFGLDSQFILAGHRSDAVDFINAMDVVVLTSSRVEGCSNSLLEAMQLGKAVVATRVGGNAELIDPQRNGLLISPQNPHELAEVIRILHDDPAYRQRLAAAAQQKATEHFSQQSMVRKHQKLYEELLGTRQGGSQEAEPAKDTIAGRPFARSMILGCPVDRITLDQCISYFNDVIENGRRCHIVVVNAAKVVKARQDAELKEVIDNADLVGADGMPIVWASRLFNQPLPGRLNGTDLMHKIFEASAQKGWRLYLLGAREEVIRNVVEYLRREQPGINIVGYRNGYFETGKDELAAVDDINAARADVLLLGFGTPMKEKWVRRHKHRLNTPIIHGVGGSFDIVGGVIKRAPKWMQDSGLEWLYRLIQEPGRMWRRYLATNTVFIWLVLQAWLTHASDSSSQRN